MELTTAAATCVKASAPSTILKLPPASTIRWSARIPRPGAVLALLCAMYLLLFVDRVSLSTVAPLMKAELGLTNTHLGLAFSAFAIPYAVFQLIGGWIGDRFGVRRTLSVGCAIVCVAT